MFYGNRIKLLEEKVEQLKERVINLTNMTDRLVKEVSEQSREIDSLYLLLEQHAQAKAQAKPKTNRRPKKNGKEAEPTK